MIYSFSSKNRGNKFIDIEFIVEKIDSTEFDIQLPAWRPGRYELANFAKNIQKFDVKTMNNKSVKFKKITKDRWRVYSGKVKTIKIIYNYYANELNAGSSWVDQNQIYVNPVNCCFYVVGRENEPIKLNFKTVKHSKTVIGLPKKDEFYVAENFDQLADSPFILGNHIQHNSYYVKGVKFNLWFQGECRPLWSKLLKDFKKFTKEQLKVFGSFPFEEYHFIFQILPYKAYHGVEHKNNTVITFGPGYSAFEGENYEELLGVASHELFHAWNVKIIRPSDMLPYDFTKENYTKMGYLTEGVTTYYGDLMLKRSGVFTTEQYLKQLNKILDRHFSNYGTQNLSVADSSFDSWLDGYEKGIPNRKSSIYVEGCLLALITDLMIRLNTSNKSSLDNLMKVLYTKYGQNNADLTEDNYFKEIQKIIGKQAKDLRHNFFNSPKNYLNKLKELLREFDIELKTNPNPHFLAARYGLYIQPDTCKVLFVAPQSPGEKIGLNPSDEILSINNIQVIAENINNWAQYFKGTLKLTILKDGLISEMSIKESSTSFFKKVNVENWINELNK